MITAEQRGEVHRLFYVEHMTINAIAEHLKIHHQTVRNALGADKFRNKRFRHSIIDPWEDYIRETITEYPRIKAPRMTQLLKDRGYNGSVSSVRAYLGKLRKTINKAYLRLEVFPSEQAQVDWADFGKVTVEGGFRRLSCFVMVLSYSRRMFACFGYDQTLESLLSYHIAAFNSFQGIPRSILYDNMKSVVSERLAGHIKFNTSLLEMAAHYRFAPKACQPYAGNQKGRVERTIRYIRDNFYMARDFQGLTDLNKQFFKWQVEVANQRKWPQNRDKTVEEAYMEEQGALIPLPEQAFDPSRLVVLRSGKTPYLCFDGNHYSFPPQFVRQALTLRATPERVAIYQDLEKIAEHSRSWTKGRYVEDPIHIEALCKEKKTHSTYRNRSVLTSKLPEAAPLLPLWSQRGDNLGRNAQLLLELYDRYGHKALVEAIAQAIDKNAPAVDSIAYILQKNSAPIRQTITPKLPAHLNDMEIRSHDPSQYDLLTYLQERKDYGIIDGT